MDHDRAVLIQAAMVEGALGAVEGNLTIALRGAMNAPATRHAEGKFAAVGERTEPVNPLAPWSEMLRSLFIGSAAAQSAIAPAKTGPTA